MSQSTLGTFDVSRLPGFIAVGLVPLDEVPAYEPTPEDDAFRLGLELELAGEPAMLRDRSYTPEQQLRFACGQRAARERVVAESAGPRPMGHEELLGRLLVLAAAYDADDDEFGRYVADMLRDHAGEAEGYGSRTFKEFDARRESMMEDLRRQCDECSSRRYEDVVL